MNILLLKEKSIPPKLTYFNPFLRGLTQVEIICRRIRWFFSIKVCSRYSWIPLILNICSTFHPRFRSGQFLKIVARGLFISGTLFTVKRVALDQRPWIYIICNMLLPNTVLGAVWHSWIKSSYFKYKRILKIFHHWQTRSRYFQCKMFNVL